MAMRGILTLPSDEQVIAAALEGLTSADEVYLRRFPSTPSIGEAGSSGLVRYVWEPPGANWWTIPEVLAARKGDCKDLSAWRAAELRVRHGVPRHLARVVVYRTGPKMFHAVVRGPWGVEDPSRALGMRGPARRYTAR